MPVSGRLKKELKEYDPRVVVLWDKIAYLKKDQARFWQDLWLEKSKTRKRRMMQIDGYKTLMKTKVRNKFNRNNVLLTVNPGECTDANTSVVDAEIGEILKKKIDAQISHMRKHDPDRNTRIETEGIHMLL